MKPMTTLAALTLAFAGTACSQEKTATVAEVAPVATPASATTEESNGGFNLMIPGEDTAEGDAYDGFNLSIPGEDEGDALLLPEDAQGDAAFNDIGEIDVPELPAPESEDDVIRLDAGN